MVEKNKRNRCHELEIVCEIKKGKLGKKKKPSNSTRKFNGKMAKTDIIGYR